MSRLADHYKETVVPALMNKFNYSSPMQVPKLEKIVLNSGVRDAVANSKAIQFVEYAFTQISGQKPVVTRARKSIAAFKLREGLPIGVMVTMRKRRMLDFMDRFISVALPRVRDFRGIPKKGFDGRGNYTMGVKEQIVFPEIEIEKLDQIRGLDITFVTSARTDEEGYELLALMGMPFRKKSREKGNDKRSRIRHACQD
jgi:large subunit ribosomal protein L5